MLSTIKNGGGRVRKTLGKTEFSPCAVTKSSLKTERVKAKMHSAKRRSIATVSTSQIHDRQNNGVNIGEIEKSISRGLPGESPNRHGKIRNFSSVEMIINGPKSNLLQSFVRKNFGAIASTPTSMKG